MTSFDFTWNSAEKPSGKVFARKRKTAENSKKSAQQGSKSPTKIVQNVKMKPHPPKTKEKQSENTKKAAQEGSKPPTKIAQNVNVKAQLKTKEKQAENAKKAVSFTQKQDSVSEPQSTFVKRKQRKDKNAAKAQQDNDEEFVNKQPANKPNANASNSNNASSHSLFSVKHKNIYVNTDMAGKSVVEKVFSASKKFSDLDIHKYLVSNLEKHSFTTLTRVQEKSVPAISAGSNVLIRSQTGSGKTLAYAVPIMDALQNISPRIQRTDGVQAIIVVPTRELALQTHELFGKINTFQWIVVGHLCGGENRNTEKNRLRKGTHVLIGTPGRLLDHILHTAAFKVDNVRCLVLDEADRLLDMGFKKDIVKIIEEIDNAKVNSEYNPLAMLKRESAKEDTVSDDTLPPLKNPKSKTRQTILLSATLNKGLAELVEFTMKDHIYIDTLDDPTNSINPEHMVIPNTVKQEFIMTYVKHRLFTLSALLLAKAKHKLFVFMATSQMVDFHYELFTKYLAKMPKNRGKLVSGDVVLLDNEDFEDSGDEEEVVLDSAFFKLHGNMDQSERKRVFTGFRAAKKGVLICTDVAARGVDVPEADCIIQYTGPQSDEDYLHRVGRTGRAGKSGSALIFLTHEEQEYITRLQEHKVFVKKQEPEEFLKHLCDVMEEPDHEKAATALQRRFESAIANDKDLHRMACFAYSSWSRFYNTYPGKMRSIFNFKDVNLGHYVTSFALRETPSSVAKVVRGQVTSTQPRRLNRKLALHSDDQPVKLQQKRKIKSVSLTTSEFSSGIEPAKKRKKKNT